jgi:hypothetical protein
MLSLLLAVMLGQAESEVTYDELKDQTSVSASCGDLVVERSTNPSSVEFRVLLAGKGKQPDHWPYFVVHMLTSNEKWHYLTFHAVSVLADDKRFDLEVTHKGFVGDGYVLEQLMGAWTIEQADMVANAKHIVIGIGNDRYTLSSTQRDKIKMLCGLYREPTKLSAVAQALTAAKPKPNRTAIGQQYMMLYNNAKADTDSMDREEAREYLKTQHEKIVRQLTGEYGITEDVLGSCVKEYVQSHR